MTDPILGLGTSPEKKDEVPKRTLSKSGIRPLEDVTIVDLSWHLAGPFCTMILADLGARVIKVEAPDAHGGYDPIGFARHNYKGQDAHYMALNRNKESMTLNLKSPRGKELFRSLVSESDVVFNNFRAGVMQRLGLGYTDLQEVNPSIIHASLSAFGQGGPYKDRPGVDLVVQALSGGMSVTGEPGGPPMRAGIPLGDLVGGMWTAIAILSALRARDQGLQQGAEIDISLLDGQIAMFPYFAAYYFLDGSVPGPQGSGGHSPTYAAFRCADDRYIIIAVVDQGPWARLCQALQMPNLRDDPRFATSHLRSANGDSLTSIVAKAFATATSNEWEKRLETADVAYSKVNRLDEALTDPQVIFRDMIVEVDHPLGDTLKFVGNPVKISGLDHHYDPPPTIGQDTQALLRHLGVDDIGFQKLRATGVV